MKNKIAIVGIDAAIGSADRLDLFEQRVYDGLAFNNSEAGKSHDDIQAILQRVIKRALKDVTSESFGNMADGLPVIVAAQENTLFSALEQVEDLLVKKKNLAVTIAANSTDGAFAAVLKSLGRAKKDQDRIYAVIDSSNFACFSESSGLSEEWIIDLCSRSFESALKDFSQVSYMEICGQPLESLFKGPEKAFEKFYEKKKKCSCALGSVRDVRDVASSPTNADLMASIIKTAMCLYHRYIPAVPFWTTPDDPEVWDKSPFYIPTSSRTWFSDRKHSERNAVVFFKGKTGIGQLILSEHDTRPPVYGNYLSLSMPFCLLVAGESKDELATGLLDVADQLKNGSDPAGLCKRNYSEYNKRKTAPYALMLVGNTLGELSREINFTKKELSNAFDNNSEIRTPRGSFFTANPLGHNGKTVFVYPGVGSAYVGLGQDLFRMFPDVYEQFGKLVPDTGRILREKKLYPRSNAVYTDDQLKMLGKELRKDITAVSECGISFSVIYTMIMAGYFRMIPDMAMGYSMGEASMMASLMVWQNPGQLSRKLRENPAFTSGLTGELTAVRKAWGMESSDKGNGERFWESYTLIADRDIVQKEVDGSKRVYLTHINTNNEVVIAGQPSSCIEIAERVGCDYFPLGLNLAIHSKPAHLEYDNIVDLYSLPVNNNNGIKFYSSSCYLPVPLRTKAIAHGIAKGFCEPVDFPRLVNKTWDDGGRIYIETGPRQICSLWVSDILKDKEFAAIPLNIKGRGDHLSLTHALAQLVGHRVDVDLQCLFIK